MSAREAHLEAQICGADDFRPTAVRDFFRLSLGRAQRNRFLRIEVPAPVVPPDRMFAAQKSDGFLWDPAQGLRLAGLGSCYRWTFSDETNLARLRRRIGEISESTDTLGVTGFNPSRLRVFGGLAFSPNQPIPPAWRDFGRGAFAIPRWLYASEGRAARLTFMDSGPFLATQASREQVLSELDSILQSLETAPDFNAAPPSFVVDQMPLAEWTRLVDSALAEIRQGHLDKVVLARVATVDSEAPFEPSRVLAQLAAAAGGNVTRFAVRERSGTFLGATPEKLVIRRGREVSTEALAGSIASATPDALAALTSSVKDQEEHRWVVDAIVRKLTPHCERLFVHDRPQVRRFGDVLHLGTPIEGHLASEAHVLELVTALHPTPAVGGEPTDAALRWIHQHEPEARGWYAGPIGWFDDGGDGEFYVAIRSALITQRHAFVYAGGGIVANSDPESEYAETALKQRSLLRGLGALR